MRCGDGFDCTDATTCTTGPTGGVEVCDDGLVEGEGVCLADCSALQECGDGDQEGDELCDNGEDNGTISTTIAYCTPDCDGTQLCGNGIEEGSETCDDGDGEDCGACNSGCDGPGSGLPCQMVEMWTGYFIDMYESSIWSGTECSGAQYGISEDDYPSGFPDLVASEGCGPGVESCTGVGSVLNEPMNTVYACNHPGYRPSVFLTWYQAKRACENVGKKLCTHSLWYSACTNNDSQLYTHYTGTHETYVYGTCNDGQAGSGQTVETGSYPACHGAGAASATADLLGNAFEWIADCKPCCSGSGRCGMKGGSFHNLKYPESSSDVLSCAWGMDAGSVNPDINRSALPTAKEHYLGFRCCLY